jgi:hypothetical protein
MVAVVTPWRTSREGLPRGVLALLAVGCVAGVVAVVAMAWG